MMSMARLRLCSHIVLYDFDRFGRDRVKMLSDFRDLERLGIEVHDCTDGQLTHDVAGQKALRADAEVRAISRRVLDGMTDRAANEELYNMPRRAPIGYKPTPGRPGQPAKDPVLAPKIAEVFDRFDKGESEGSLARWWRQQTGRPARPSTIRLMLRNEYYAGVAWFNRTSNSKIHGRYQKDSTEWVSRAHDQPIVDRDVFDRVQAQLDTRAGRGRPYGGTPQHSLTGILTCAECGHRLMVHAGTPARAAMLSCETCKKYRSYSQVEKALQALLRAVPAWCSGDRSRQVGRATAHYQRDQRRH